MRLREKLNEIYIPSSSAVTIEKELFAIADSLKTIEHTIRYSEEKGKFLPLIKNIRNNVKEIARVAEFKTYRYDKI